MENGGPNGAPTDHNRSTGANGINGVVGGDGPHHAPDTGKAAATVGDGVGKAANGGQVATAEQGASLELASQTQKTSEEKQSRMNDLPDEIIHITQGFIPLSLLLSRLAQNSHNAVQDKIADLAKMQLPASAVNGNASHAGTVPDDASSDNIRKKKALLDFAQDMHAKWVKALVITEWSRKGDLVSKLIDLKFHIDQQRILYDSALGNMINVKRDLTFARMPSPDLKTALQILSTGAAPWLPDLQYIEPPPLTFKEQAKWTNDLDTLLSLRLNLDDYDKIPYQFKDYAINSGRVTFKVPGEFEVDLTIADEDFEKQFWFIDFRFSFKPSPSSLPETLRSFLEGCVNEALEKDGLEGCYQFLHEFVLTFKINELKRQAIQLSRSSWTGTLVIEPLNRALAIQYWTSRTQPTSPKSWVLLAIHNRPKKNGRVVGKSSSYLVPKWYRDNKEVQDVKISMDTDDLSAESLLRTIVGLHIEFLLTNINEKLQATPRFRNREAGMALHIDKSDPAASYVETQVGFSAKVSLLMEPTTGFFAVKPHSKFAVHYENQLNHGKNPAEDGMACLENVRCGVTEDQINRRGVCMGWHTRKPPVRNEVLKAALKIREWTRTIWLQKEGWGQDWYVAVLLGLGGDEWWVVQANGDDLSRPPTSHSKLPLNKGHPDLSDIFWGNLTIFATGMIAQACDMRELHRLEIKSKQVQSTNMSLPQDVRLPNVCFALSALFASMKMGSAKYAASNSPNSSAAHLSTVWGGSSMSVAARQPWAHDSIAIQFNGIQPVVHHSGASDDGATDNSHLVCISDALICVKNPAKFASLNGKVDDDVSYDPRKGEFCLRVRHAVGESVLPTVQSRVKAIDRFVDFLESLDKTKGTITSEAMTLRKVSFTYGRPASAPSETKEEEDQQRWRVVLNLSKDDIDIEFEKNNPHLRVVDMSKRLVNSDGGVGALMSWLPSSLPIAEAIDRMETAWESIYAQGRGNLDISMKAVDWMTMHYTLPGAAKTKRELLLDVKVKQRRCEPWWHVWRTNEPEGSPADDGFDVALKPIWDAKGEDWRGLSTSATGRPDRGVVSMLEAVDEALRNLAAQDIPPAVKQEPVNGSSSQAEATKMQPAKQQKKPQGQPAKGSVGNNPVVVLD